MNQIDIITDREKVSFRKHELDDAFREISNSIKPNVPILIKNRSWIRQGHRKEENTDIMFFSDGTINKDFKFGILGGKRNNAYLEIGVDSQKIVGTEFDTIDKFIVPYNFRRAENIGIPGVRTSLIAEKGAGTTSVIIGEELLKSFPEEYRAIKFAGNAIYFDSNKLQLKSRLEKVEHAGDEASESISIDNVLKLIANAENTIYKSELSTFKVSTLNAYSKILCNMHNSAPDDYIIKKAGDVEMWLGIMKIDRTDFGNILVLPINQSDGIIEKAFSLNNIDKNYDKIVTPASVPMYQL
jgi:hypothetical protein